MKKIIAMIGAVALVATGCTDLDVDNPNAPDRERALATAGDVESLIGGSFKTWWSGTHWWYPGPAMSTMADEHSSSWGNYSMKDSGAEPRREINNSTSYTYSGVTEDPWYYMYGAISAANDGLRAIDEGLEIGTDGEDTPRAKAFARFIQGISHGFLAMTYDQAFIFPETFDPNSDEPELKPYPEVQDAAIGYLEDAIALAEANEFTVPSSWIPGPAVTSDRLVRLAHSYIARVLAQTPRSPAERADVDWNAVLTHVDQGIQEDFAPVGDGFPWWTEGSWYDVLKTYGGVYNGWARVDLRMLGPADTTGAYQAWEQTPPANRQPFFISTPDRRIAGGDTMTVPAGDECNGEPVEEETLCQEDGMYVQMTEEIPFPPERGTYHFSNYRDHRYDEYANSGGVGPMDEFTVRELRLIEAEALYRTGDEAGAADIVNETRVDHGELPAVTASGIPDGPGCVPHSRNDDGDVVCGDVMDALEYEKRLEVWHTAPGIAYFDDRGWGDLVPGTPIHFPVPAKELEILRKSIYTFGGDGEGAAPSNAYAPDFSEATSIK